jgi:hypothetical protein
MKYPTKTQQNYEFVLIADKQRVSGTVTAKHMLDAAIKTFSAKMGDGQEMWKKYSVSDKYLNKIEPQLEFVEIAIFNVLALRIKKCGSRKKTPVEVNFWQYPTHPFPNAAEL